MMRPLLVMPCSARKSAAAGMIPAKDRYDGSAWRTLRANRAGLNLDVLVLSAAHGFIWEDLPIATYDRKLDHDRSREILGDISAPWFREKVIERTQPVDVIFHVNPHRVFFMGSSPYIYTMCAAANGAIHSVAFDYPRLGSRGRPGIGEQLAALKAWLINLRAEQQSLPSQHLETAA